MLLAAVGCGGGSDQAAPLTTAPVEATLAAAYTIGATRTATTRVSGGDLYGYQITREPSGAEAFEGATRERVSETWVSTRNGETTNIVSRNLYVSRKPLRLHGSAAVGAANPGYTVYSSFIQLPVSAAVGQAETFLTGTTYADSSKATVLHTISGHWSVEAGDDDSFVWVCVRLTTRVPGDRLSSSQTDCYGVDASGGIGRFRVIFDVPIAGCTVFDG